MRVDADAPIEDEATGSATADPESSARPEEPDWQDRYLRLAAEFDNFRKRSAREFGDLVRNAERELIGDLTEVLDNLDRALKADHKGESVDEFAKGVALIREQFWRTLDKRAEACYACHAEGRPIERLPVTDRARIFEIAGAERILGIINPIQNEIIHHFHERPTNPVRRTHRPTSITIA